MDAQKPTLPNLLDIAIPVPSYQPEPSNRRPATTSNSTRQGITFDGANFPASSKAQPWGQTSSSFRPGQVIHEQKGEDDGTMFSFSPFRTPFKALPKLYTTHQHETMSHKFKNLKQRYQKLYKKIEGMEEGHGQGLTDENLKEIYLEAEKMFSKTYSVKYFGVQGEELGIASKRLPMNQGNGPARKNVWKKENSLQENISRQGVHSRNVSEAGKPVLQVRKNTYSVAVNNNKANDFVVENGENEESKVKSSPGSSPSGMSPGNTQTQFRSYKPNMRAQSQPYAVEKESPVNNPVNKEGENEEEDLDKYVDEELASTRAVKGSSMTGRLLSSQGGFRNNKEFGMNNNKTANNNLIGVQNDAYVVTKYLIPKKLQTVKKSKNSSIAAMSQTHRIFGTKIEAAEKGPQKNFHSNASTHRVAQEQFQEERGWPKLNTNNQGNQMKLKKASSLEKKVASMEKVKRSLLRNVHVEKAWEARPYKDELDIPERFRTYEVKKVMADNAKYSYAKLLETMNTNDRPETALIGTTEKMERILSVRDEKRKFLESKSGKRAENYGDVDKRDVHGNYVVKVWYPKENEMFNRFWKIKHGVVNEQEEENQVVTQE